MKTQKKASAHVQWLMKTCNNMPSMKENMLKLEFVIIKFRKCDYMIGLYYLFVERELKNLFV